MIIVAIRLLIVDLLQSKKEAISDKDALIRPARVSQRSILTAGYEKNHETERDVFDLMSTECIAFVGPSRAWFKSFFLSHSYYPLKASSK